MSLQGRAFSLQEHFFEEGGGRGFHSSANRPLIIVNIILNGRITPPCGIHWHLPRYDKTGASLSVPFRATRWSPWQLICLCLSPHPTPHVSSPQLTTSVNTKTVKHPGSKGHYFFSLWTWYVYSCADGVNSVCEFDMVNNECGRVVFMELGSRVTGHYGLGFKFWCLVHGWGGLFGLLINLIAGTLHSKLIPYLFIMSMSGP